MLSRRGFALGLSALSLTGCASAPLGASTGLAADLRPSPNAGYDRWVAGFQSRAQARGISSQTLRAAFRGAGYLPGVIKRDRNQTEFKRSLEDYLSIAVSDERLQKGRAAYNRHQSLLRDLEARYGVDAEIIAAIWGLESFFGDRRGDVPELQPLPMMADAARFLRNN